MYLAIKEVVGKAPSPERPYIWNDNEQALDEHIALIAADITAGGRIVQAISSVISHQ